MIFSTKIILFSLILPALILAKSGEKSSEMIMDGGKRNFSMDTLPNCTEKHDDMDQSSPRPIGLPPCKPPLEHHPRRVGEGEGPNKIA
ncbi:unnamed protein product [Meloidogyne enterolobii]|uniref:Uncharacterized protein n=1 Tax=Meloidogyne enterolobii TaxID=390850 RepID=A0ACB1A023_MELEN